MATSNGDPEAPAGTTTVILMGVSGSGKTTLMDALVERLGWPAAEGDAFHPAANVEKMRTGHPLTDDDRWPWLEALATWIGERERAGEDVLVTCSALKRAYREVLRRGHPSVWFVHLVVPPEVLEERLESRRGHYMPSSLLPRQLETLEPLGPDEPGVELDATADVRDEVDQVLARLEMQRAERHAGRSIPGRDASR